MSVGLCPTRASRAWEPRYETTRKSFLLLQSNNLILLLSTLHWRCRHYGFKNDALKGEDTYSFYSQYRNICNICQCNHVHVKPQFYPEKELVLFRDSTNCFVSIKQFFCQKMLSKYEPSSLKMSI